MKVELYMYMQLTDVYYAEAPYVMIGVGAGIILIGSLGCCCTVKGTPFLLYVYAAFLVLVFIAELAVSISAFLYKGKIEDGFESGLDRAMNVYGKDEDMKKTMDKMQQRFECCGNKNASDWYSIAWDGQAPAKHVPESCCRHADECDATLTTDVYTEGCYTKLTTFTEDKFMLIGGVAIGFSFLQLFGALVSCGLAKNINKAKYDAIA
jgi:tetraspanin-7